MIINHASETLVLPDRFLDADWDKISINLSPMLTNYLDKFKQYETKGLGPALFGTPGTGKTYASAALAKKLVEKTVPVYWAPTVQELNMVLDLRDYKSNRYFIMKNRLMNTRVVVFDDFGQLRDFSRIRELFFEIIDHRYSWKKPTIFTANFAINSSNEEDWEQVASCFNASLARRIRLMSQGLVYNEVLF